MAGAISILPNQLFLWPAEVLYVCRGNINEMHEHYAISLWIAFHGQFAFETENQNGSLRAAILPPNVRHRLHAPDCRMAVLQVDPDARDYRSLLGLTQAGQVHELNVEVYRPLFARLEAVLESGGCPQGRDVFQSILQTTLAGLPRVDIPLDSRIRAVLDEWKRELPEEISVDDLAARGQLSSHRFMHLFKEEMGLPVRRYLLWLRTNKAVRLLKEGMSLTEAAHDAGFADSAHMSRTFKEMVGIHPSFFFKDSRFVQAHFCKLR